MVLRLATPRMSWLAPLSFWLLKLRRRRIKRRQPDHGTTKITILAFTALFASLFVTPLLCRAQTAAKAPGEPSAHSAPAVQPATPTPFTPNEVVFAPRQTTRLRVVFENDKNQDAKAGSGVTELMVFEK